MHDLDGEKNHCLMELQELPLEEKTEVWLYDENGKDTEQTDHLLAWIRWECRGRRRLLVGGTDWLEGKSLVRVMGQGCLKLKFLESGRSFMKCLVK